VIPSRHRPTIFRAAVCSALLAHAIDAQAPGARDVEATPELVTWHDLSDHCGRYVNHRVRLVLQFQSRVASWNPYITRFGTRDYTAFQFWGDDQLLWNKDEFDAAPVRLFARKHFAADWALETAPTYARYEIQVIVREIFLDQPWAEIETVIPLAERVSEGTIIHAGRALELMQTKAWKLADNELEQAQVDSLPDRAKDELAKLRDACKKELPVEPKPKPGAPGAPGKNDPKAKKSPAAPPAPAAPART
jgi:hypothetical protein